MRIRFEQARAQAYLDALRSFPPAGGGVHGHVLTCANLAAIGGVSPAEAETAILAAMPRPPSPRAEVAQAIRKAFAEVGTGTWQPTMQRAAKPPPRPETAQAFIRRGDGATEADWWERSPIRFDWPPGPEDALAVLDALFSPDEFLFLGERYETNVLTVRQWRERIAKGAHVPPHVIPNPLDGKAHPTGTGKPSFRGDAAVGKFRFAVAEFDTLTKAEQLSFWWGWRNAPIAALVDSGGKSIHAWLRVDMPNRETWAAEVEEKLFACVLVPLGCDPACRNESRLSRMPGHFRREKNAWQRILYLNPEAGR